MKNVRSRKIKTTLYVDCGTKNNLDLVQWAISAYQNDWGYVMGTFGQVLTVDLLEAKMLLELTLTSALAFLARNMKQTYIFSAIIPPQKGGSKP